ncbi:hypothetical protein K458DRAFT_75204 [Lentithecium fluviatile CBS 122367]|uniref:Uncharacterized protein n=1 Tax=Lentithecium fluviatile CBS 122367 TaxID=1168545 RepID=A0A6G1IUX2_9PLEO|nr:hypothetical protein K458DRAFT_75204 [Lentithecium fluviatile CBS 122367]
MEDARYNPATHVQPPTDPSPFHNPQQAPQQYDQNTSHFKDQLYTACGPNTNWQAPQQGSPSLDSTYTLSPQQSGYSPHQSQAMSPKFYAATPVQGYTSSFAYSQYTSSTPQDQPRTFDMPGVLPTPQANYDTFSEQNASPPTYGNGASPPLYNSQPDSQPYDIQYSAPQRSVTVPVEDPDPQLYLGPLCQTVPWEGEWNSNCYHSGQW